ncbi:MAG: hypothetical protein HZA22_04725 [Nitrospirae bacterium]|nr:hypothetical protein [Nitrospirota bacterium]
MALTNGYIAIRDNLAATLAADSALDAFCQANFGQSLSIRKGLRKRTEVQQHELPLVMVVRNGYEMEDKSGMRGRVKHKASLYVLYESPDADLAEDLLDELDGLLDMAVLKDVNRGGLATNTRTLEMGFDEGRYHPVYGFVKLLEIVQHVNQEAR